ncbi:MULTISPECIES: beta-ketoacyl [acyl carrier protein] synthase domain-containing protein [Streptomyces]|uniref:beta-ketoacyl [acyl carrier protein] synthase domain-containing protein n=1 Tax=Streptomyces TaxID=1883 RepID=UPI0006E21601|nr:polyketide synthase [Streptomyces prasinus]
MDIREILIRYKEGSLDRGSASQLLGALTVGEFGTVPSPEAPEALEVLEVPVAVEERVSGGLADTDADVVAVVGMAGRYPRAADLDAFWQNVSEGRDTSAEAPADRPGAPLLGSGERGHFLDAVDEFDPEFFGLTEDEGRLMDPQERLFLETAWEALEDAGCTGSRLDALTGTGGRPRAVGVFVGAASADYALLAAESWARGGRRTPRSGHWGLAGRLSAQLRLSGPAQAVDTSWSSGLVAVHHAVQALRRGECAAAVAGAVELLLHPSRARAGAGEGVGAVVLKPLRRALADGDRVYAVIRATSAGGSARTVAPARFGLCETRGSTVGRIGDAGAATGIAALTSAVLQLRHGVLAPAGDGHGARPWQGPRHAVVAFAEDESAGAGGVGGLGAHLVVEEFVPRESRAAVEALLAPAPRDAVENAVERDEHVLLSAPTPRHLAASAQRLAGHLDGAGPAAVNLPALARALRGARSAHPCRVALRARDVPRLVASLRRFVADDGDITDLRDGRGDPLGLSALPETADYLAALWRSGHVERLTGLWLSGVEIDWVALEGGPSGGRRHAATPLPPSAFLRRPLWLEPDEAAPVHRERRG